MTYSCARNRLSAYVPLTLPILLAVISATVPAQSISHQITLPNTMNWCDDSMINELFFEINSLRVQRGLAALRSDTLGNKVAEQRAVQFAEYMRTHPVNSPGFNPHEGYESTAANAGYNLVSENLAYLSMYPKYIVWAIWQDRLHLAAMLAPDANVAGVSCVFFDGGPYWSYEPGIGQGGTAPAPAPSPSPTPTTPAPNPSPTPVPPVPGGGTGGGGGDPVLDTEQARFLTLLNAYRAQNGAGSLQVSVALQNAAQWMSQDMANRGFGSHIDSLGRSPSTRMAAFGYTYYPNAENIAGGFEDAQSAFDALKNACDPDASGKCTYAHRLNMLSRDFVVTGVGRVYGPGFGYGWYWTNDFGGVVDRVLGQSPTPSPSYPPSIASFTANPNQIVAGQAATLSWSASSATTLFIEGIGDVSGSTSRTVSPTQTTAYRLTASNSAGSVSATALVTVSAAPSPVDNQAPTVPVITSASVTGGSVNLAWSASSDNVGVTGYQVIRNGLVITSVSAATRTYVDVGVNSASTYIYQVRAFDGAGNLSNSSAQVQITTSAAIPPPSQSSCPNPATNAFTGCYYNNLTMTGTPVLVRTDTFINFNWGTSVPSPAVTPFNFSTRWQGYFTFEQALYTFSTTASDGMRIYIDGELVLDRWRDQPAYGYSVRRFLSAGQHLVTVEFYQRTGLPFAQVFWSKN